MADGTCIEHSDSEDECPLKCATDIHCCTDIILHIQMSDLLFILLCVPFTTADYALTSVWPFGSLWCSSVQYLIIVTVLVSIYTLVLMSLDRCRVLTVAISASKSAIRRIVITEKAPTRAFSWLKAHTSAFTLKTLLRHY